MLGLTDTLGAKVKTMGENMRPYTGEETKEIEKIMALAKKEANALVRERHPLKSTGKLNREMERRALMCQAKDISTTEGKPLYYYYWTEYFHAAMNRMTKEAGLRC